MRLIDADALKRRAQKVATESWKMNIKAKVETVLNQFIDWIDEAPTIEPSAGPELDEWCYDCKEYDKEKHSCPRWNRVIRNALKDAQPKIIYCKNCKFTDGKKPISDGRYWCVLHSCFMDFCSDAERRTDGSD